MRSHTTTIALALSGVAWTAGQALLPDTGLETAERYDRVADARALETLSGGLLLLAGALLVLGALALARRVVAWAPERSRALTLGAALLALGGIWLAAGRAAFNIMFFRLTDPEVDRDAALAALDAPGGVGFVPLVLTLPCLLVGPLLLAVGLRRNGASGWLPLAAWVVGIGVFLGTEFTVKAGEVGGIAVASAALVMIGLAVDRSAAVGDAAVSRRRGSPVRA